MSPLDRIKTRLSSFLASREGQARRAEALRRFQTEFLLRLGLERGHRFLDLEAGSLAAGSGLIEFLEPGHYTALVADERKLERLRRRVVEAGLDRKAPRWIQARDPAQVELPGEVDWVYGLDVLPALDDERLESVLGLVARTLAVRGVLCADARLGGPPVVERSGAQGPRTLEDYRRAARRHGFTLRDLGTLSGLGHTTGDPERDGRHMLLLRRAEA
jgi:hypothetical protein